MGINTSEKQVYEFGPFRLDVAERFLLRDGAMVTLEPKVFQTLVVLVENSGHLLTKDELMSELWPDAFVEEGSLTRNISTLRRTLGEGENGSTFIETVPKQGYRFMAGVKKVSEAKGLHAEVGKGALEGLTAFDEAMKQMAAATNLKNRGWRRGLTMFLVAASIISATALLYLRTSSKLESPSPVIEIRSIAVLPFKPLAAQTRNEALELGLADSLITKLGMIKQLTVRPTSAVLKYANLEQDSMTIGRTLLVDAVLESTYQQAGTRLQIHSQLVRVEDGKVVWAFQCGDQCVDILTMQESVAESIAQQLRFNLTSEEQKGLAKRYTDNLEAYQLYLYGRSKWNMRTRDATEKAIDFFVQALDRDPNYAPAYAGLADCYITLGSILAASLPRGVMPKAKYAAQRAIDIDDTLAEAHASLGFVLLWYEWDFEGAKREFDRAVSLDPKYATAHQWYAHYFTAIGHHEEAIREARLACELDPTSPNKRSILGYVRYFARQYNQAIEDAERAHELDGRLRPMYSSGAYLELGRYTEAVDYHLQANAMAGEKQKKLDELRRGFQTEGIRGFWKKQIEQFKEAARPEGETNRYFAMIYSRLGEKNKSLLYLEKMFQERNGFLIYLKVDPAYDNLRGDPRFTVLLRRVGLA
ncbi:MAG: winged helix-turn-helix domain-containing tetratricopeptide repeat protein [Pyrinomonadaceae bacterium]